MQKIEKYLIVDINNTAREERDGKIGFPVHDAFHSFI